MKRMRPHQDRLQYALRTNRVGKVLQHRLVEIHPRLERIGIQQIDRQPPDVVGRGFSAGSGRLLTEQRGKAAAKPAAALKKAADAAVAIMSPAADARGPVEYRKHVGGIMVTRALQRAAGRAK